MPICNSPDRLRSERPVSPIPRTVWRGRPQLSRRKLFRDMSFLDTCSEHASDNDSALRCKIRKQDSSVGSPDSSACDSAVASIQGSRLAHPLSRVQQTMAGASRSIGAFKRGRSALAIAQKCLGDADHSHRFAEGRIEFPALSKVIPGVLEQRVPLCLVLVERQRLDRKRSVVPVVAQSDSTRQERVEIFDRFGSWDQLEDPFEVGPGFETVRLDGFDEAVETGAGFGAIRYSKPRRPIETIRCRLRVDFSRPLPGL